ncbi:MAG: electron transfer flavoprotein subunit alpha/FixB family protein [Deltaproteobacteria bacterium]|nr:electron transfer flavoprotein subunit alpha/FixB family protein [Deltaproteobacteria bacterium]
MSGILVFAESEAGAFKKTTFELLGKAVELGLALDQRVYAAVLGDAPAASLGGYGASKVFQVAGSFGAYSTLAVTAGLAAAMKASGASVLLAAASYAGKDALPRLAARLDAGHAPDITDLRVEGGALVGRRPVYSGKAFVDVRISSGTAIYTVRPNSFPAIAAVGGTAEVIAVTAEAGGKDVEVLNTRAPDTEIADLTEAVRIVSGGRGVKDQASYDSLIRPLAAVLGATPGASRAAVDAGFAPHSHQVGQTGKTVNPQLYIATGISGAIQHLAGMRTSKVIVAINKDPEAPIFEYATYGIVDDLFAVVPALTEEFKKAL